VQAVLDEARVLIAPVTSTGVTTKLLFAFQNGVPAVTTPQAAESFNWGWVGDPISADGPFAVASDPFDFAQRVHQLMTDSFEWTEKSQAGLDLARMQVGSPVFADDVASALRLLRTVSPNIQLTASLTQGNVAAHSEASELFTREFGIKRRYDWDIFSGSGSTGGTGGTGGTGASSSSSSTGPVQFSSTGSGSAESLAEKVKHYEPVIIAVGGFIVLMILVLVGWSCYKKRAKKKEEADFVQMSAMPGFIRGSSPDVHLGEDGMIMSSMPQSFVKQSPESQTGPQGELVFVPAVVRQAQ